jgi:hypothetical protein
LPISSRCIRVFTAGRIISLVFVALIGTSLRSSAQTAPQLLPYTTMLIAGGSSTSYAAYSATNPVTCTRTNSTNTVLSSSGNKATDIYGDGCLATEISLTGPRFAVMDTAGAIFFSDYTNGLIRRVDPLTGVVIAIAGGAASTPSGTVATPKACGGTDTNSSVDTLGDECLGTSVKLGRPVGLAFSPAGDLYFADYYNYNVRKIAATNKLVTGPGVITLADGSPTGADGFAANNSSGNIAAGSSSSLVRSVYGVAFDAAGNLYISDEYYYAVVVVNTNATGSTTVAGVTIPAGTEAKIVGTQKTSTTCVNGTATSSGCASGPYVTGAQAGSSYLYNPYGIALDGNGNLFIADENYGSVAEVNLNSGVLTDAAGLYSSVATTSPVTCPVGPCAVGGKPPQTQRAPAGSFAIGSDFGVAADSNSNLYVTDALNGYVWRVDSGTNSMYVVAGGGSTASIAGSACPNAGTFIAVDTYGDGCPALVATFSKSSTTCTATTCYANSGGIFGVSVDANADLLVGDENNNVVREIASGTQFGSVGATQTDVVDIHFAASDGPIGAGAYTITAGAGIFSVGSANCTANTDTTMDCLLPITASPTAAGAFMGTLTVKSNLVSGGTMFPLSGNFVQSPITRTALTTSSSLGCSGVIYATTTPVVLKASIIANGPVAPSGTIVFFANGTALGSGVAVTNLGTTAAPVYGATLTYTFSTAGSYNVTATYTPTTYFIASTSSSTAITATTPTFATTVSTSQQNSVHAGQTALYSFTLAQTVYSGTIAFACSGLPANSSCSFSPSTITAGGCTAGNTVALSIFTTAHTVALSSLAGGGRGWWRLISMSAAFGLALLVGIRRRSSMRFARLWSSVVLLALLSGLVACNSNITSSAATPTGTYNINVTATGSSGTVVNFSIPLTVE